MLIHSAGGGVGIAATQIAKRVGAEVWGTASPGKHEAIRGFGVDHPIDYTRNGLGAGCAQARSGHGRDRRRQLQAQLQPAARPAAGWCASAPRASSRASAATWSRAAKTALQMPWFNMIKQMSLSKSVIGLNVLTLWDEFTVAERWTAPLTELLADGTIKPVVAEAFTFERAPDAHRFIAERRNIGKVVLVPRAA